MSHQTDIERLTTNLDVVTDSLNKSLSINMEREVELKMKEKLVSTLSEKVVLLSNKNQIMKDNMKKIEEKFKNSTARLLVTEVELKLLKEETKKMKEELAKAKADIEEMKNINKVVDGVDGENGSIEEINDVLGGTSSNKIEDLSDKAPGFEHKKYTKDIDMVDKLIEIKQKQNELDVIRKEFLNNITKVDVPNTEEDHKVDITNVGEDHENKTISIVKSAVETGNNTLGDEKINVTEVAPGEQKIHIILDTNIINKNNVGDPSILKENNTDENNVSQGNQNQNQLNSVILKEKDVAGNNVGHFNKMVEGVKSILLEKDNSTNDKNLNSTANAVDEKDIQEQVEKLVDIELEQKKLDIVKKNLISNITELSNTNITSVSHENTIAIVSHDNNKNVNRTKNLQKLVISLPNPAANVSQSGVTGLSGIQENKTPSSEPTPEEKNIHIVLDVEKSKIK